ncbi:unnamed protein product [Angiostrongylus costaricensis]|uniref:Aminopeptidase n=1 Tax=Angiostrongylus costaricensis TaxID=334426 RepID=A0A0R3PAF6_ANGCS|nr:unnamed protein product [Angiostrongylus costaricensis]
MMSIKIDAAKVTLSDALDDLNHVYDQKFNIATIDLGAAVTPQTIVLSLEYTGEINDKMRGFYRSSYKDDLNREKFLASTQFESTYARYAFPCFDEPIYKATFDVSLVVDPGMTAISNMPYNVVYFENTSTLHYRKIWVKFERTPQMSTYLLAFVVGELDYIQTSSKYGTIIRVYTVPGKRCQGTFSLDLAAKAIDWYSDWFGIEYPLPKCDLVAIPDFSMGAMENWGLVTYREVALLIDPSKSSTRQKSRVALVVAHELAHFWFGNLVTMKWWTDLWLKEGFASFMEYLFVGYMCPEFKIWEHFVNDELAQGFNLDALRNSHPIEGKNPCELEEIYDKITYAKSNAINRMLFHYLGEQTFQAGLRLYLKKFQYDNAVTLDLWDALHEASGQDVAKMMSGWTKQMGYPVITVKERQQGTNRILTLSQRRFIADGGEDLEDSLWQVPINVCVASNPAEIAGKFLMVDREQEIEVPNVTEREWIKLNAGAAGFYRVEYSSDMIKAMISDMSSGKMLLLDRFSIVNDLFALVTGRTRMSDFLSVLAALHNEEEYIVWQSLAEGIDNISNVLDYNPHQVFLNLPDSQRGILRAVVHGRLMRAGHGETIARAATLFADHVKSKRPLHPDLRLCVCRFTFVRNGGEEAYDQLIHIFEVVGFPEVERNCITALAQSRDPKLLNIFKQSLGLFNKNTVSRVGQEFLWNYFKENMSILATKFGGVGSCLFQVKFFFTVFTNFFCQNLNSQELQILNRPIKQVMFLDQKTIIVKL